MGARNFRDYSVWKEAVDLATHIYTITSDMPWFEKKGLCDQIKGLLFPSAPILRKAQEESPMVNSLTS